VNKGARVGDNPAAVGNMHNTGSPVCANPSSQQAVNDTVQVPYSPVRKGKVVGGVFHPLYSGDSKICAEM
jgi:hypothetical protein